ncbi:CDP-diacylglycerol--glycerol-3-phosphate 3-phosphatidyltransferase [Streptomyces fumanus]
MEVQETRVQTDRVLTIPNILSMARLVGVPLFLWLILRPEFGGPKSDGWALLVLALSGISDYLDGKLARRWNQVSSLGRLLDPAADRFWSSVHPGRAHLARDPAALADRRTGGARTGAARHGRRAAAARAIPRRR